MENTAPGKQPQISPVFQGKMNLEVGMENVSMQGLSLHEGVMGFS